LIAILNDTLRTGNPAQWRTKLEGVFNVDHFLNYLAVNTAIMSWDAYGVQAHNFYLYHHSSGKLTWIPWDLDQGFDLALDDLALSLGLTEVGASWPLIRYLADDPVYYARYREHLRSFYDTVFTEATVNGLFDKYHGMIAPYVIGPDGELPGHTYVTPSGFTNALPRLKNFVTSRRVQLAAFLGDPGE
jgi:spore coat protein H